MHANLAARSYFSIGESIISPAALVAGAAKVGAKAVAMCDVMSVTGLIEFTGAAKKAGIKPIIGCRLRLVDDLAWRKKKDVGDKQVEYFATLYALTETGLKTLYRLLTLANTEANFYGNPRVSFADLEKELAATSPEDLRIATGDFFSMLRHPDFDGIASGWAVLGHSPLITVTPIDTPYWDRVNVEAFRACERLGFAPIITRPASYAPDEADEADVMRAVCGNVKFSDGWVRLPAYRDLHPMTNEQFAKAVMQMAQRLRERFGLSVGDLAREGIRQTDALVDAVSFVWAKQPISLPPMAPDEFLAVVQACQAGWATRFSDQTFGHRPSPDELRDVYKPRLAYELSVLKRLNFSGYFLLVQEIVQFAKTNGILVGPGRGSVGGSLVAYLMGITDCDPIRFGLLFERFINPDRIDLPDADLDFMASRRHEIFDFLVAKYGAARVAGISNFGKLGPASAIRNIGKALGLSEDQYRCSKLAPKEHGANVPLPKAAETVSEIGKFRDEHKELWGVMTRLEGTMNILGRHAAGIVVGGRDLVEHGVVERRSDGATICWDKRIVEDAGLVKVDALGLQTLDLINLAIGYIRKRHSKKIDLLRLPLDDPKILANFAAGRTVGVFQFESGGMRRLLKNLGRDGTITFDDVVAATALYRPGPMESGMMDSYWKRKQGAETVEYDHPLLEEVLKPTFGVFVYQEQVMRASVVLAGYSGADADKLRKIMGKKLPEEMRKERGKFVEGCVKTVGMTEDDAGALFDKIEGFAGYGFNKSHSVEYTLISWQSMWLKTYYPVEFYAAALSLMPEDKLAPVLADAETMKIKVDTPDINLSSGTFEILTDTELMIPFIRVKGISEKATTAILAARAAGKFTSQADFVARVEKRTCNKRVVEVLERIGAFASVEPTTYARNHPDRLAAQKELIPGLIAGHVPVYRSITVDKEAKAQIVRVINEYRTEKAADGVPVKPTLGKNASFMVIADAPTSQEEKLGVIAFGESFSYVTEALDDAGLSRNDAYWTALLKRPKAGKMITAAEIDAYMPYLAREIAALKPPAIVLLGSTVVRQFLPDFKGKASEAAGEVIYSKAHDANLVIGFNPNEIYYDADKQIALNEVFARAAELTS